MIFDLFTPSGRGVANGVFSWGIYFGYALAYILGITAVDADILGHGWRSVYVMCSIPGFAIGICILLFLQDPKYQRLTSSNDSQVIIYPYRLENKFPKKSEIILFLCIIVLILVFLTAGW